jgi:hypothetical protein
MGEKPTAGYRIEVDVSNPSVIENNTLKLNARFLSPQGELRATVMTRPCVVFSIDKGDYKQIIAGDTGLSIKLLN